MHQTSHRELLLLSFSLLGAIYGDLGTSPLYVLNSMFIGNSSPSPLQVYGAVSCIFYVFTIIVIVKYVFIVLMLGPNNGEGGQVAIYAKIARSLNLGPKGVVIPGSEPDTLTLLRNNTSSTFYGSDEGKPFDRGSPRVMGLVSKLILVCCFLGCSLVFSDGLLTPTTSVLSAIAGIQVAQPSFNNVLAVSEVIIVLLFVIQQFGSAKISFTFAPIIFVWLLGLLITGIYNIARFHPGIFQALSPYHAIQFLRDGNIDVLGAAMLSVTGTEAMFADIGHFGRLPVQLTLGGFVYPCLMACYLGQGAYLIHDPTAVTNPFYLSLPGGTGSPVYWVMFVLAALGTVIASQALILGVFSIVAQLIALDCCPRFRVIHVSRNHSGRVYIPVVNWLLMVGVVLTTAGFQNSNNVTAAYGLGITLDFLVTSVLLMVCMVYVYRWNGLIPLVYGAVFLPLEVVLVVANLKKVVHGAWFPLVIAGVAFAFLSFWRWGRSKKVEWDFRSRVRVGALFEPTTVASLGVQCPEERVPEPVADTTTYGKSVLYRTALSVDLSTISLVSAERRLAYDHSAGERTAPNPCPTVDRYPGVGILYTDTTFTQRSPNTFPQLYKQLVTAFPALPEVMILCGTCVTSLPTSNPADRIEMVSMTAPGHYRCILRFGFMEDVSLNQDTVDAILACVPGIKPLAATTGFRVLHIFEHEIIRSQRFLNRPTHNPLVRVGRILRRGSIHLVFSPLTKAFQSNGQILKVDDEADEKQSRIFVGTIVRI